MSTDTDVPNEYPTSSLQDSTQDVSPSRPTSWLSTIRTRLGLGAGRTLRDTIESALEEAPGTETAFSDEERAMLRRLLRFGKSRVEDIMVPRADIIAIDDSESIQDLLTTFEEAGVSRVPVFTGTLDDPHSMIHIKDLFRWLLEDAARQGLEKENTKGLNGAGRKTAEKKTTKKRNGNGVQPAEIPNESKDELKTKPQVLELSTVDLSRPVSITKLKRPLLFVPPSMPSMNLLIRMQSTRNHMALVIDEYGGTDGLVTIEDLVEQVVGDIEDEHDDAEAAHIIYDPIHGLIASARTPLEELEHHLDCKLVSVEQEEDIDTLGGLVFTIVGRVPPRGEIVRHPSGIEFEVLDADPRRVKTLKIHLPQTVERAEEKPSVKPSDDHK